MARATDAATSASADARDACGQPSNALPNLGPGTRLCLAVAALVARLSLEAMKPRGRDVMMSTTVVARVTLRSSKTGRCGRLGWRGHR